MLIRSRIGLILWLCLSVSGCAGGLKQFQQPQVQLVKIDVLEAKLLEQHLLLTLRVENPNDTPFYLRSLNYELVLNRIELAKGDAQTHRYIPAQGAGLIEIPVRTNLWRHLKGLIKSLKSPNKPISYQLEAELRTGMPIFGQRVHLQHNGEIIPGDFLPE